MYEIVKELGLNDCITFRIGNNTIMLNEFQKFYNGGFGSDDIIIQNRKGTFYLGVWKEKNKIVTDLELQDIEVFELDKYIREKIYDKIVEGLFDYVEENKDKQLFNEDSVFIWRDYSVLGESPLTKMLDDIKFDIDLENLKDDEVVLVFDNEIIYNLVSDRFYRKKDNGYLSKKDEIELVMKCFTTESDRNLYVLYHNYINNHLKGEDLAYKEIADLNKWLKQDNKKMVSVCYKTENYEDLEDMTDLKKGKVMASTNGMFSDLRREYYKEMFSFWGVQDIKTIKQIRGFEYRNDFYKFNVKNLLYKKEVK